MNNTILQAKESNAVIAHINMLQGVIKKMDDNSKQCKQWCVALETIFIAIIKNHLSWYFVICAVIAVLLFMVQDAGYLAFSRFYRKQQKAFVDKINTSGNYAEDIYLVQTPEGWTRIGNMLKAVISLYVWAYYIAIAAILVSYMYFFNN